MSYKKQNLSEEQKFEQKLFYSLKKSGYLFPETINDVDKFEELYGDTEIDVPEHLELPKSSTTKGLLDFDFTNKIAAFSNNDISNFKLPENLALDKDNIKNKKNKSKK